MKKRVFVLSVILFALFCTLPIMGEEVVKKKIVFLKDDDGEFFKAVADLIGNIYLKKGYTKENSEYIVLSMGGNVKNVPKVVKEVKDIKPDLMLMNGAFGLKEIADGLKDTTIPIVVGVNIEKEVNGKLLFIDNDNNPKGNVTGMHLLSKDYEKKMFGLMNFLAPIKDKKVVMIMPKIWKKKNFENGLNEWKIPLKKYESPKYWEDAQELLLKYNKDDEVGWIIMDDAFEFKNKKNMKTTDEKHRWIAENSKKPGFGFYEVGVKNGHMCGIAIDSMATVELMTDMGVRILKGEKVKDVKADYPPKALILLNQWTAYKLGYQFSPAALESAWRVYTDYKGTYVGRE